MNKQLIIIGAGGHGKVAADIASLNGYESISFLDDSFVEDSTCTDIVGNTTDAKKYLKTHSFFIAIGSAKVREKIHCYLESLNAKIETLVHPNATVASDTVIGKGTIVVAGAVINPGAVIGKGVIVNTSSSVDHDCNVSDFVHVSVGTHLCGAVAVGKRTWIGAGATVVNNLRICEDCMIGAGAVVVKDIEKAGVYVGVPARSIG